MASTSGDSESLIQVDEHDANPSMLPSPIGTPTSGLRRTRFGIADETIDHMCDALGKNVRPDDDDAEIQGSLSLVWVIIKDALSEDLEVIERLADEDEFKANVKEEGEKKVIELLRDTAKKGSWLDIIENSTYFTPLTEIATLATVFRV